MKFGKLLIQGAAVFLFIVSFSLAGAITPQFTTFSSLIDVPANFLLYLVTVIVLTAMGYFLGVGIQSVKKSLESLGLAYGGSLPWLLIFFIGTPIMLTFVVC